jgi:TetR/AcrR family transcriptional repressor of lmrAB and yxaGH operons
MSASRERILETTCKLMEARGLHATGLTQIIRESHAPMVSLYYCFPEGQEELIVEAGEQMAEVVSGRITSHLAGVEDPAEAVRTSVRYLGNGVGSRILRADSAVLMLKRVDDMPTFARCR